MHFPVLGQHRSSLAGEGLVFVLLRLDTLVREQLTVSSGELLHQAALLVIGLQQAVLIRPELFEL